jgi:DNA polymerase elongation subunit (family B)
MGKGRPVSEPKILLYDLETFPNIGYTWTKWETNVIKFVKEWELASFAWKWLGESKISVMSQRNHTEKQLATHLAALMNESDIIVAHNGDNFDLKKSRVKFLQHGIKPPAPSKTVDTKKVAKSRFAFNSNSLNDLAETLKLGKKVNTGGFELWEGCMRNDKSAWALMEKYNKQDVDLLEKVYLKLRGWMTNHPNMALIKDIAIGCPSCGSEEIQSRGYSITAKTRRRRLQCQSCACWFQAGKEFS